MDFKPKISTFLFLCFGLTLFGLGEGLLIVSFAGASPWSVLAQGISLNVNFSTGIITIFVSYRSFTSLVTFKTETWNWNNFECDHYWFND